MKKNSFFIAITTLMLASCTNSEINSLFDTTPEKRAQETIREIKTNLTEAPYGWIATYEYGEPKHTVFMNIHFENDNTFTSQFTVNEDIVKINKGSYSLTYSQQLNLLFDTHSFFSSTVRIWKGDFIFELVNSENKQYIFKGRDCHTNKTICSLTIRKATQNETAKPSIIKNEYIELTTTKVGENWIFFATGNNIWVDLNDNGLYDDGEEMLKTIPENEKTAEIYAFKQPIDLQTIRVYGTEISLFFCPDNELISIDVSQATHLQKLYCHFNQLTNVDVTHNPLLKELICHTNRLKTLNVIHNPLLESLLCYNLQLVKLDISKNKELKFLRCNNNQLKGKEMTNLVKNLPVKETSRGQFYVINTHSLTEGNVCDKNQVAIAKGKGWNVWDYDGQNHLEEYEGSPVE